jgi:hypothetical protein
MEINNIAKQHGVCSLELSKELKKAGMPQKSLWYWVSKKAVAGNLLGYELINNTLLDYKWVIKQWEKQDKEYYSAFNATELADVLPENVSSYKFNKKWRTNSFKPNKYFDADTLANALAKMVLHLLEKGILKKEDL